MRPAPSVVVLCNWIGNEGLVEKEEEKRLRKDDDIVHLVQDAIGNVYAMQQNNQDA